MTSKNLLVVATANSMTDLAQPLRCVGEARLASLGFGVRYGKNVNNRLFHVAGSTSQRIVDFSEAVEAEDIYGILSVYGGYNSNQLLDALDYVALARKQKPIVGYSDFTAILNAVASRGGRAFHGPGFASFCDPNMFEYSYRDFGNALNGLSVAYQCEGAYASDLWFLKTGFGPREVKNIPQWRVFREGEAEGKLYGGNLETFCALLGTPYLPDLHNGILFVEDATGSTPGCFHRFMTQLQQSGILSKIKGLIIGKSPFGSKLDDFDWLSYILNDVLNGADIPVLCDVFCSHVDPIATFPLGVRARLKADQSPLIMVNL